MAYDSSASATTTPTHPVAIISVVLSILGLVGLLPLVGPIGAIITGGMARSEIAARPGAYSGDNLARVGITLGWVGLALAVLGLLAFLAVVLLVMPYGIAFRVGG